MPSNVRPLWPPSTVMDVVAVLAGAALTTSSAASRDITHTGASLDMCSAPFARGSTGRVEEVEDALLAAVVAGAVAARPGRSVLVERVAVVGVRAVRPAGSPATRTPRPSPAVE